MPNRTQKSSVHRSFSQTEPHFIIPPTRNGTSLSLSTATTTQQRALSLALQSYIYIQAVFGGKNDDGVVDDKVVSTER
jgi:hypothetical protein